MKTIIFKFCVLFLVLTSCNSTKSASTTNASLEGTWQLNYISGSRIAFGGLYPDKKPALIFNLKDKKVSGNNSCNQYFGSMLVGGNKINFKDAKMGMTMMACQGNGDAIYMDTLEKIDSYSISENGNTLNFIMGDIAMMRFEKIIAK